MSPTNLRRSAKIFGDLKPWPAQCALRIKDMSGITMATERNSALSSGGSSKLFPLVQIVKKTEKFGFTMIYEIKQNFSQYMNFFHNCSLDFLLTAVCKWRLYHTPNSLFFWSCRQFNLDHLTVGLLRLNNYLQCNYKDVDLVIGRLCKWYYTHMVDSFDLRCCFTLFHYRCVNACDHQLGLDTKTGFPHWWFVISVNKLANLSSIFDGASRMSTPHGKQDRLNLEQHDWQTFYIHFVKLVY